MAQSLFNFCNSILRLTLIREKIVRISSLGFRIKIFPIKRVQLLELPGNVYYPEPNSNSKRSLLADHVRASTPIFDPHYRTVIV